MRRVFSEGITVSDV